MQHQYTLYVDEAGDDKVDRLKPDDPSGNSEWLCIGGYLIRSELEASMSERRDKIRRVIGGRDGEALHYRNLKAGNRLKACKELAKDDNPARAFVVCSCKRTYFGYHNPVAEAAAGPAHRDTLYNYIARLLLERVTALVEAHAAQNGITRPKLRIVFASRRGHHFGQFKAYLFGKLVPQAIGGTTFQDTGVIRPDVLAFDLVERETASSDPGLQLADIIASAFFQSLERASPNFDQTPALALGRLMAKRPARFGGKGDVACHVGVTLFHPSAGISLEARQRGLFEHFGYSFASRSHSRRRERFTQKERIWSHEYEEPK